MSPASITPMSHSSTPEQATLAQALQRLPPQSGEAVRLSDLNHGVGQRADSPCRYSPA